MHCIRNGDFGKGRFSGCDLRRVALNAAGAGVVVLVHVVVLMSVSPSALQVTVLQVSVDVEVLVHAVRLLCVDLSWEVALKLLQLVLGEEIGWWEHHLLKISREETCLM